MSAEIIPSFDIISGIIAFVLAFRLSVSAFETNFLIFQGCETVGNYFKEQDPEDWKKRQVRSALFTITARSVFVVYSVCLIYSPLKLFMQVAMEASYVVFLNATGDN